MAFIFCLSAQDVDQSTDLSLGVGKNVEKHLISGYGSWSENQQEIFTVSKDDVIRDAAHCFEYAVLGVLLMLSFSRRIVAFVTGQLYSLTDEIHQIFVPGRACQLTDMLIDGAGVLIGVFLVYFVSRSIRRCKIS